VGTRGVIENSLDRKNRKRPKEAASAALRVSQAIRAIVEAPRGINALEAASAIGLSRTASLRLLDSMVAAGILSKDEDSRRYDLSLEVLQWASRVAARFQPSAAARHEMSQLAKKVGHQVIYSVLDRGSVVVLEATEDLTAQVTTRPAWSRTSWATSTTGTVIVAFSEPGTAERLLTEFASSEEVSAWPESEMRTLLEELRQQGYAERFLRLDTTTVAAPVLDYSGYAVAALGMLVKGSDLAEKERCIDLLKATAAKCSSFLGHSELNSSR
jgi:DNA-binding IclR family transcriptional regulator